MYGIFKKKNIIQKEPLPTQLSKLELNKDSKELYVTEESWERENWSSPGKSKPIGCPVQNS